MDVAYGEKRHTSHHRAGMDSEQEQPCKIHDRRHGTRTRHSYSANHSYRSSMSSRRGIAFNIPRFGQVSGARQAIVLPPGNTPLPVIDASSVPVNTDSKDDLTTIHDTRQQLLRSHSLGPLTPPHDIDIGSWSDDVLLMSPVDAEHDAADYTSTQVASGGSAMGFSTLRLPTSHLPAGFSIPSQGLPDGPWLDQALRTTSRGFEGQHSPQYIELVSQVLPNHASDKRLVKTSELVCDHLQQTLRDLQGITITHAIAVPQSQVVEDYPKSPPSTPNFRIANGYFDEPIVVTKAANVPVYHGLPGQTLPAPVQIQRRIMVRPVVDLALIERYIPPTTAEEITDFFNADSYRSYLADRLSELSIGNGSLLLVYPTRSGGKTFARKYIAPMLDPLLREMAILRGLDTDAAQKLGTMDSVDSMLEFAEMQSRIEALCTDMSEKCRVLSVRSSYDIVHCQEAEIVLDRATWMTWYVEQEQQRMKQNLVDYHKDGGRLPLGDGGSSELTAGMLTREIIEGLQKSKKEAGNVGIEVGVFVVKRTKRTYT